jgi:DTW domain-containing protein YfiP
VVLLQHPREARVAIGSAAILRMALPDSEVLAGVHLDREPRLRDLLAGPGTALLFPGDGAQPASRLRADPPRVLLVPDGTWHQAERMLAESPSLASLPRLRIDPSRPSGYGRLRREPAAHCLSTVEAVAEALGDLEGDPARFAPMRLAFRRMVEAQLDRALGAGRRPRHRRPRPRRAPPLALSLSRVVVAHVEAHPAGAGGLRLAALRPGTGERLEGWLPADGPDADLRARWLAFVKPGDAIAAWGPLECRRLAILGTEPLDLRAVAATRLRRRPGHPAEAARALGGAAEAAAAAAAEPRPFRHAAFLALVAWALASGSR